MNIHHLISKAAVCSAVLAASSLLPSCVSPKEVLYIQDVSGQTNEKIKGNYQTLIQKDDQLSIPAPAAAPGRERIPQADYLKGILITLMVLFHLSRFSTYYLDVTRYVYVFHMSGFIILSGFFANTDKAPRRFLKTWLGILVPYLVFEALYYLALSLLPASIPASNRLEPAFTAFWKTLLLGPAGTYWYLYLLVVCLGVYHLVSRIPRLSPPARLAISAAVLTAVS